MIKSGLIDETIYLEKKYTRAPNCMSSIGIVETSVKCRIIHFGYEDDVWKRLFDLWNHPMPKFYGHHIS